MSKRWINLASLVLFGAALPTSFVIRVAKRAGTRFIRPTALFEGACGPLGDRTSYQFLLLIGGLLASCGWAGSQRALAQSEGAAGIHIRAFPAVRYEAGEWSGVGVQATNYS